jgi:hypothetical protein
MPGLLRAAVGTAVIAGTAQATRNAVNRHSAEKDAQAYSNAMNSVQPQQQVVYAAPPPQQQYYAPPPPQEQYAPPSPPPAPAGNDLTSQLQQLAQLHTAGVLSDEEFAAAKQKLLAS